jgi:hypothetical protein
VVLLRRPLPRFLLWALVLVGVAVATGLGGLAWWWIVLIELASWALVTLAERAISNRLRSPAAPRQWELAVAPAAAVPAEVAPTEQPTAVVPAPEPAAAASAPVDPPRRRLGRPPDRTTPPRQQQQRAPVRWNIWSLERVAREHPESEELGYLVLSLRDFADAAGQLPADFDPLVRESFGDLLVS